MSWSRSQHWFNNDGSQRLVLPALGSCATGDDTRRPSVSLSKRQRLKEIVERLGPKATPTDIRQEAYRLGFGPVNSRMLISVRNELWPDRPKHPGGRSKGTTDTALILPSIAGELCCPICGSHVLRIREVFRQHDGSVRRGRICKSCGHRFSCVEADTHGRLHVRRRLAMAATEKECSTCKRVLPVTCFARKANDAHLYRSSCRECLNRQRAAHYLKEMLARYGLDYAQYQSMLEAQGGKCCICRSSGTDSFGKPLTPYRFLCIDHNHRNGTVRGLLCDKCNLGLGNFDDDPVRLDHAAAYLRHHHVYLAADYSI